MCKDCSFHSQKINSFIPQSTSSSSSQLAQASSDILSTSSSSPFTSIYSRDRSQRKKTGEELFSCSSPCWLYSQMLIGYITYVWTYALVALRVWLCLCQVSWGQYATHVSGTANRAWHLLCLWSPSSSAVWSGLVHRPGPRLGKVKMCELLGITRGSISSSTRLIFPSSCQFQLHIHCLVSPAVSQPCLWTNRLYCWGWFVSRCSGHIYNLSETSDVLQPDTAASV